MSTALRANLDIRYYFDGTNRELRVETPEGAQKKREKPKEVLGYCFAALLSGKFLKGCVANGNMVF